MAEEGGGRSERTGARRTRSQAAPGWSPTDALILVNEIAAVEADCSNALASFQKWKIIAENCAAQDVSRNLNQLRRKWNSLRDEHSKIKKWESQSRVGSYWGLESGMREELGLPKLFDEELFKAIDNLLRARGNKSDTDPDSDPEAKGETVDGFGEELGGFLPLAKKKRRLLTSKEWKRLAGEDPSEDCEEENPSKCQAKVKLPKCRAEKNLTKSCVEEHDRVKSSAEENPQKSSMKKNPRKGPLKAEETNFDVEDKKQILALILRENAEKINFIVAENAQYHTKNMNSAAEDHQNKSAEFVRFQGDKIITCLGDIVKTLGQLCDIV